MDKFIEMVDSLTKEWNERDGGFSAEFSTSRSLDQAKRKYLAKASKRMTQASWRLYPCDVCKGYSHANPVHVEINQWHTPHPHSK